MNGGWRSGRLSLMKSPILSRRVKGRNVEMLRSSFSRQFDQMVAMMPKQELIELAEALVSITAVERKATSDDGTVGADRCRVRNETRRLGVD